MVSGAQALSLRAAVETPLNRSTVILVEDVHLSRHEFLDELFEIAKNAEGSRLLLVISYRRAELARDEAATIALARIARLHCTATLEIEPLDRVETHAFVRTRLEDGVTLSPHMMERLERLSGGNPLLLHHLVAHALTHRRNPDIADEVPLAVSGIVAEWLQPLTETERSVLSYAALMRGPFDASDVGRISGDSVSHVAPVLRHASALNILKERRGGSAAYTFRHWVVAEVLERAFLPHQAQALHATIAGTLESSQAADTRVAELAAHWQEAGQLEAAALNARRAGNRAFSLAEYEDAAYWYE